METEKNTCSVSYKYKAGYGLQVESVTWLNESLPKGLTLKIGMKHEDIESNVPEEDFKFIKKFYDRENLTPKWKTIREKCFISAELSFKGDKFSRLKAGIEPTNQLKNFVTRLIHVPGLRGNPERIYKIAASEDVYPGSFEKYVASIISVEIQISRSRNSGEQDCVNLADVGFGVSQTIPVLVALIGAKKGQYVYIEQPELHLHPKAQFKLAGIIASAINRGVQVIIETHSSILIRGIQIAVVKKELDKERVSLNWFTQDIETGETRVSKASLDEFGAFGDWPEDFDDTSLTVEQMYLDAVEEVACE